jgi:hypothetical protein
LGINFREAKAAGHCDDHTIPSYAEVSETDELYFFCSMYIGHEREMMMTFMLMMLMMFVLMNVM